MARHLRPKYACRTCEAVHQARMPSRPIERGRPGPGLLAQVRVAKSDDHLPLQRQSEIYAREGVELERSTLADWVGRSAALTREESGGRARPYDPGRLHVKLDALFTSPNPSQEACAG